MSGRPGLRRTTTRSPACSSGCARTPAAIPDTMDHRFGAWAQLLTLFRLSTTAAATAACGSRPQRLPLRPRPLPVPRRAAVAVGAPARRAARPAAGRGRRRLPVLRNLLILDGERLCYRTPRRRADRLGLRGDDGLLLEVAAGRSIAVKPKKAHGAPATINLEALLDQPAGSGRSGSRSRPTRTSPAQAARGTRRRPRRPRTWSPRWTQDRPRRHARHRAAGRHGPAAHRRAPPVRLALHAPLPHRAHRPHHPAAGPRAPRASTRRPEQILDLKVCDPADGLGRVPGRGLPPARRRAGRGLARTTTGCRRSRRTRTSCSTPAAWSPSAASTAWTRTPWPSTSPSSRCGSPPWPRTTPSPSSTTPCAPATRWSGSPAPDRGFHWEPTATMPFIQPLIEERLKVAADLRRQVREAADGANEAELRQLLEGGRRGPRRRAPDRRPGGGGVLRRGRRRSGKPCAQEPRGPGRRAGCGPAQGKAELREAADAAARGEHPVTPFHWEIEFPEVFERENPGFDAIVGNPPFCGGKNTVIAGNSRRLSSTGSRPTSRSARQRRPCRALLPPGFRLLTSGRRLRPDRDEHDRARATPGDRPALDLHARRDDLRGAASA